MRKLMIAAAAPIALAGCTGMGLPNSIPAAPVEIADQTVLDEQIGITVTLAYTASAKMAALLIRTGAIKDTATIRAIGVANERGITAVEAVRAAYDAGNADSYAALLIEANRAVADIQALNGDTL